MTSKNAQKVMLAVLHPVGEVSSRFYRSVVNLLAYDSRHHGRILHGGAHLDLSSGAQITTARNEVVKTFLATPGIDWLWLVDADMEFAADTLDRLVDSAHPEKRPIVGGLCFALMKGSEMEVVPTIYADGPTGLVRSLGYPPDRLVEVGATGAACLLIHRSALLKIAEYRPDANGPKMAELKWPWFAETLFQGPHGQDAYSEDLTFCLRARLAGLPIHVDTAIKIGHQKPVVVDEAMFLAQPEPVLPQTYVVIPKKAGERDEMTANLVASLGGVPITVDDSDAALTEKWNDGMDKAAAAAGGAPHNVAILNNDLEVPPGFLEKLAAGLRQHRDHWIAYPNHHGADIPDGVAVPTRSESMAGQTLSGWAFMVRGESGLRFDPQFRWWYSDADIQKQVEAAGKHVVCVGGVNAKHLEPTLSTRGDLLELARADERRFAKKWKLDPKSLFLAQTPEFGQ